GDLPVEHVDEARERVVTAHLIVEARLLAHPSAPSSACPCALRLPRRGFHTGRWGAGGETAVGLVFGGFAPRTRCAPSNPESVTELSAGRAMPCASRVSFTR